MSQTRVGRFAAVNKCEHEAEFVLLLLLAKTLNCKICAVITGIPKHNVQTVNPAHKCIGI